jgi:hypothetical protein
LIALIEDADFLDTRVDVNIMNDGRLVSQSLTASEAEFFAGKKTVLKYFIIRSPEMNIDQFKKEPD